jgi:sugar phosphate isomerase/epimerase
MIAISLPWTKEDNVDVAAMLKSVKELGLDAVELGYTLTQAQIDAIVPLMKKMAIKASSVHSFSPVPDDKPSPRHVSSYYRISAVDEDERKSAVRWMNKSIDTAVASGAPVVVLHAGGVDMGDPRSPKLLDLYKQGKAGTVEFVAVREELLKERERNKGPFLEALVKSFDEIMPYAQGKNIKIGLETRYYPTEIPNYKEIGDLLKRYCGQGMHYWHDVGHAEVNSRLGITDHEDFLRSYGRDLIGVHLHGVEVLRDHLAPFVGDFDLPSVLGHFHKDTIKVIESRFGTFDQLKKAVAQLKNIFKE